MLQGKLVVKEQFQCVQHGQRQFELGKGKILVQFLIDFMGIRPCINQVSAVPVHAAVGTAELEPPGVRGRGNEQCLCCTRRQGPLIVADIFCHKQPCGSCIGVYQFDGAQMVGRGVVVNDQHGNLTGLEKLTEVRQLRQAVHIDQHDQIHIRIVALPQI